MSTFRLNLLMRSTPDRLPPRISRLRHVAHDPPGMVCETTAAARCLGEQPRARRVGASGLALGCRRQPQTIRLAVMQALQSGLSQCCGRTTVMDRPASAKTRHRGTAMLHRADVRAGDVGYVSHCRGCSRPLSGSGRPFPLATGSFRASRMARPGKVLAIGVLVVQNGPHRGFDMRSPAVLRRVLCHFSSSNATLPNNWI